MKIFKRLIAALLVLFLLLSAAICALWLHNHNYSGRITEFRDLGNPEGLVFSLDGKYPEENMMLRIEGPNVKKFLYTTAHDLLPHVNDYVHIKGPRRQSSSCDRYYLSFPTCNRLSTRHTMI